MFHFSLCELILIIVGIFNDKSDYSASEDTSVQDDLVLISPMGSARMKNRLCRSVGWNLLGKQLY